MLSAKTLIRLLYAQVDQSSPVAQVLLQVLSLDTGEEAKLDCLGVQLRRFVLVHLNSLQYLS